MSKYCGTCGWRHQIWQGWNCSGGREHRDGEGNAERGERGGRMGIERKGLAGGQDYLIHGKQKTSIERADMSHLVLFLHCDRLPKVNVDWPSDNCMFPPPVLVRSALSGPGLSKSAPPATFPKRACTPPNLSSYFLNGNKLSRHQAKPSRCGFRLLLLLSRSLRPPCCVSPLCAIRGLVHVTPQLRLHKTPNQGICSWMYGPSAGFVGFCAVTGMAVTIETRCIICCGWAATMDRISFPQRVPLLLVQITGVKAA